MAHHPCDSNHSSLVNHLMLEKGTFYSCMQQQDLLKKLAIHAFAPWGDNVGPHG